MIDNSSHLFSDFITVDKNPYDLELFETFKENGEIKSKTNKIKIDLQKVNSPVDLILNNCNFEIVDYYPKTLFKKIFNIKKSDKLQFIGDENNFVFMSEKTSKIFKTNCKVYSLEEDDKVIIGTRTLLVIFKDKDTNYMWVDQSNYKTILIR